MLLGAVLLGAALFGPASGACAQPAPAAPSETPAARPAALRLPVFFSEGMVVQRSRPAPVWGWAAPGDSVAVTLASHTVRAVAGADSTWRAELPAMEAGGPFQLRVAVAETTLAVPGVLVGEVWLASGQSNMVWRVKDADHADEELAAAGDSLLHLFKVESRAALAPRRDVQSDGWRRTDSAAAADFSAAAYFFGQRLRRALGVPVGLIQSAWGGTTAQAWTSRPALQELPAFNEAAAKLEAAPSDMSSFMAAEEKAFEKEKAAWWRETQTQDPGYEGDSARWADPAYDAAPWPTMQLPQAWEHAGLPGFDGAVWFRKEVDLPADWAGQDLTLSLGRLDDVDTTWVNGTQVGSGSGGPDQPRQYAVPAEATRPGRNLIAVRVLDTERGGGALGPAETMFLAPKGAAGADTLSLTGAWRYQVGADLFEIGPEPRAPRPQDVPSALYNAMIAPLTPLPVRGVIWYQGESNAKNMTEALQYRALFPALIQDWRARFEQPELPFLFVQLANFREPQQRPAEVAPWPTVREAQREALALPHTAMAVTTDIGEAGSIHPTNKQDVGKRLALAALHQVYGRSGVVFSGPVYERVEREGRALRLHFSHAGGGGLVAKGDSLKGFALAGPDQQFVWAEARIDTDSTVVVRSPDVEEPVAVRYGWAINPVGNLFNAAGLPASPFRTDDWPLRPETGRAPAAGAARRSGD